MTDCLGGIFTLHQGAFQITHRRYPSYSKQNTLVEEVVRNGCFWDFPGGAVVGNPPANAGDMGSSPGPEDTTCRGATEPMHHNY